MNFYYYFTNDSVNETLKPFTSNKNVVIKVGISKDPEKRYKSRLNLNEPHKIYRHSIYIEDEKLCVELEKYILNILKNSWFFSGKYNASGIMNEFFTLVIDLNSESDIEKMWQFVHINLLKDIEKFQKNNYMTIKHVENNIEIKNNNEEDNDIIMEPIEKTQSCIKSYDEIIKEKIDTNNQKIHECIFNGYSCKKLSVLIYKLSIYCYNLDNNFSKIKHVLKLREDYCKDGWKKIPELNNHYLQTYGNPQNMMRLKKILSNYNIPNINNILKLSFVIKNKN